MITETTKRAVRLRLAGFSVAAAVPLLTGCIFPAPPSSFATTPVSFSPDNWVKSLGDHELEGLVREALAHNHDLAAAASRIQTASAEAKIASSELFPTLSGSVDGNRRKQVTELGSIGLGDFGGFPADAVNVNHTNSFGVALNTSWEIDLWGRIRKGAAAATADLQASEAEYAARSLSLTGQTAKAWFALTEARLQLELAQRTAKNFSITTKQTVDRVDSGIQSPTDKYLAESSLASAEALVEQWREAVRRASRQLEILIGRFPSGSARGANDLPKNPKTPPSGIPANLIARRPDLIAAERRVVAQENRVGAAKASLYPRLSLTGSGGRTSSEFKNLTNGDFGVWSIAGNLVQPIFEGGRLRAQVQSSRGQLQEVSETFAQQALVAYSEVGTALAVDQVIANRVAKLGDAANAADKADEVSGNRYDQGVETFIVVLESQRRTLDAQSALITSRRARLDNLIDLHLALGGSY